MDDRAMLVKNWLIKALHDLAVAKKLKCDEEPYYDVAIYHCQQAAEKAIKGMLVFHEIEFPKTHDLRLLVQLAGSIISDFAQYADAADILTPYATEFRYPGEIMDPTPEEMEEGVTHAEKIVAFVVSLLPDDIQKALGKRNHPQQADAERSEQVVM